jgi:hypothetical protein
MNRVILSQGWRAGASQSKDNRRCVAAAIGKVILSQDWRVRASQPKDGGVRWIRPVQW